MLSSRLNSQLNLIQRSLNMKFFVGDEMFWGKDRLDFVEAALTRVVE